MFTSSNQGKINIKIKILIALSIVIILLVGFVKKYTDLPVSIPKPHLSIPQASVNDIDPSIIIQSPPENPVVQTPVVSKPLISAEAYLVGNLETGQIYSQYNPEKVHPIASLSKLLTSLVTIHNMEADQKITITQKMLDDGYGTAGELGVGETYTSSELLYPLLLESSNDAAEALAQAYGYDSFIVNMNEFAHKLGMNNTEFKDPSGISQFNVSNAEDLFTLAKYLYRDEKSLLAVTRLDHEELATTTDHGSHYYTSINPFVYDPHFIGGKTGRTDEAKESMISLFDYNVGSTTYPVAVIVLRSDFGARQNDSSILFDQFMSKL